MAHPHRMLTPVVARIALALWALTAAVAFAQQPQAIRASAAETVAAHALTRADTYLSHGLYQKAKDAFDAVANQTDSISAATRARARLGADSAAQKLFDDEPKGAIPSAIRSLVDIAWTS